MKLGNNKYAQELQMALQGDNAEVQERAWENFSNAIVESIKEDAKIFEQSNDKNILVQRGYRQLTNAETKYYEALINASKMRNVQQASIALDDAVMPETIIDEVMRDLVQEHALLAKINVQNVKYATRIIMNDHSRQLATWGEADAEIEKEIVSAFKVLELVQAKLSAFCVIPMAMLDLGVTFIDGYVRNILKDALACALEDAVINGDGDGKPVGMAMKLTGAVDGVHAVKSAQAVTAFDVAGLGALIARMSKDEKGKARKVGKLALICNAQTYFTKVAPAVRVQNFAGAYVDNFAFDMEVIISEAVADNKAVLADLDRYFLGVGFAKEGVIAFSDEHKFVQDQRVYKIKTYANGRALDENSALLLDVSGLEEAVINIKQK